MRIADDLRKATVFLGYDITGPDGEPDIDARATGFFVRWATSAAMPQPGDDEKEQGAIYLVTARHNARKLGSRFVIRYNKFGEVGSDVELVENPEWKYHSDNTVDIAVLHWGYPEWSDCVPILGRFIIRPGEYQKDLTAPVSSEVGIGDIAYVIGLFNPIGRAKINLPLVYTGHIALLPNDYRIAVYDQVAGEQEVECYLVQAPGISGLSGAPVFVRDSYPVYGNYRPETNPPRRGRETRVPGRLHGLTGLLGLWSASWADPPDETLVKYQPSTVGRKVPIGFGIVVPAYKIAETLNQPELIAERRAEYARRMRDDPASTDDR